VNKYQKASVFLALGLYLPLAYQLLTHQVTQNLATWVLWVFLDAIAVASMFVQKGNFQLPTAYVAGGTSIVLCIATTNMWTWTIYETIVTCMVAVCITGWYLSGPRLATILSTSAMALATIPQLKDVWQDPTTAPTLVYVGYTLANIFSTVGGKNWSIEERFYPSVCTLLCILIVMFSLR